MFAWGDCNATRMNEEKGIGALFGTVEVISQNLKAAAAEQELREMPKSLEKLNMIPFNHEAGGLLVQGTKTTHV